MSISPASAPPSAAVTAGAVVAAWAVTRRYGEQDSAVDALRGVSMRVPPGEFTAVMGPSGSGKSTLMHILAGLDVPTTGQVWIGGEEITEMGDDELTLLRRRRIGFIFQFFNLLPMLTAEQNVVLPLSIAGEKPERDWVDEVIAKVGLVRPAHPQALRALRRPAAARGDRPRARLAPDDPVRRRADRQPRLHDQRRDPRADAGFRRQPWPDDADGHPRRERRGDRRPHPVPGRRARSSRTSRASASTRCWRRWRG